jgi:transcriptional regulator with XRE-family HTH domain
MCIGGLNDMDNISQYRFLKNFGRNLKAELEDSRETLEDLSEDSGIPVSTLSKYVNGLQMPSLTAFINILCALDLEPEDLIDFDKRVVK